MKTFLSKVGDMFLDQGGGVDEKRVIGIPTLAASVIYVLITGNLAVFAAVAGLGTTLLGIGVLGDQGKLNVSPSSATNPTAGIPGS